MKTRYYLNIISLDGLDPKLKKNAFQERYWDYFIINWDEKYKEKESYFQENINSIKKSYSNQKKELNDSLESIEYKTVRERREKDDAKILELEEKSVDLVKDSIKIAQSKGKSITDGDGATKDRIKELELVMRELMEIDKKLTYANDTIEKSVKKSDDELTEREKETIKQIKAKIKKEDKKKSEDIEKIEKKKKEKLKKINLVISKLIIAKYEATENEKWRFLTELETKHFSETQSHYKSKYGVYAGFRNDKNPMHIAYDQLFHFLNNDSIKYQNTDQVYQDSLPANSDLWEEIKEEVMSNGLNKEEERRRIYKQDGGEWRILSESDRIKEGYIEVNYDYVRDGENLTKHFNNRDNIYPLNKNNFTQLRSLAKSINIPERSPESLSENMYVDFSYKNKDTTYLDNSIPILNKEINNLNEEIKKNKRRIIQANNTIDSVSEARKKYIEVIGSKKIEKIKERVSLEKRLTKKKQLIYNQLKMYDSLQNARKNTITNFENNIQKSEKGIKEKKELINNNQKYSQCLSDLYVMMNEFIKVKKESPSNISQIIDWVDKDSIKNVRVKKPGGYRVVTNPELWEEAERLAEKLILRESLQENVRTKIMSLYLERDGEFRPLTNEEMQETGRVKTTYVLMKDDVFDEKYLKTRDARFPIEYDKLMYIPNTKNSTYQFYAKLSKANESELEAGETDKKYVETSANYDLVFQGLKKEVYKNLLTYRERTEKVLKIGDRKKNSSLDGNWGEIE